MNTLRMFLERLPIRSRSAQRMGKLQALMKIGVLLLLGISMNACSRATWKEEVLLHDGSKVIVERWQSRGGRHELTQRSSIKEHGLTFTLPGTSRTIAWNDEYDPTFGYANFNVLALHILKDTPYLIVEPDLCLSYNKWGRPNPPYVILKHDGNAWQRIQMADLPVEFTTLNMTVSTINHEQKLVDESPVPATRIRELNSNLKQAEYKRILREPIKIDCKELVYYEGGWVSR